MPMCIKAELVEYKEGIKSVNNYILSSEYKNRNRYLVFNVC